MSVLLLDTLSLFYRAHHALPFMSTTAGEPTGALYGFSALLLKLAREHAPAELGLALDSPQPTFRHAERVDYKQGRQRGPQALLRQLDRLDELCAALALPVHRAPGFEADDVLATLARELAVQRPLVVSGDTDVLQLAGDDGASVLFVGARGKPHRLYDAEAVRRRFGVEPRDLPSYSALVGDPSDNLPGVPGIGPRIAARLVARHRSVEGMLAHIGEIRPATARASLEKHAQQALECERLARLIDDVPLTRRPRVAAIDAGAVARTRALFVELEFKSLLPRLDALGAR